MRFIGSIILLIVGVGGFFIFTNPLFGDIQDLEDEQASLNEALGNAQELQQVQDELVARYNTFDDQDRERLRTMVPNSADNIRLIIEIEKLALSYDIMLNNVSFEVPSEEAEDEQAFISSTDESSQAAGQTYGTIDLSFSAEGAYQDFTEFLSALEQSLRIVDISSLQFSSGGVVEGEEGGQISTPYQYQFTISTYWLKDN